MDPNACLDTIRTIITRTLDKDSNSMTWAWEDFEELCEHVATLDRWMSTGGVLPSAWRTPGHE